MDHEKRIVVLGSTGSIGENVLRIVESLPERFRIVGLAAGRQAERVVAQAAEFGVSHIALADPAAAKKASESLGNGAQVLSGLEGVEALATMPEADLVICSMVGMAALRPVLAAIEAGHDVALATKEVLVAAGELVCSRAETKGVNLLPIDSEHSAIFQVLCGTKALPWCVRNRKTANEAPEAVEPLVEKLWLTASGGPFFFHPEIDFDTVTPSQALKHPRWRMGPKVTIDSATMMNKGLEILEARWLFNIPASRIGVLVHPESIVHSLVEFTDGAQLAQLGFPDMRVPIQYAMSWPWRMENRTLPTLRLAEAATLHFSEPDVERFPSLRIVREASFKGGVATCTMNAANEIAVEAFLEERIRFSDIWRMVGQVVEETPPCFGVPGLDTLMEADSWARRGAKELVG